MSSNSLWAATYHLQHPTATTSFSRPPGCSRDGCSKWGAAACDAAACATSAGATAAHGAGGCN